VGNARQIQRTFLEVYKNGGKMIERLEDIGFYTLSNERANTATCNTRLWRCELILTSFCNYQCPYCRGINDEHCGNLSFLEAKSIVDTWCNFSLKNIRFSGGEPTLWDNLIELICYTKEKNVERIAISTNGSADLNFYLKLIKAGVNDISISLDACCAETGDKLAGNKKIHGKSNLQHRAII
jgi:Molybdenum cofactor biosynthesis enzyme